MLVTVLCTRAPAHGGQEEPACPSPGPTWAIACALYNVEGRRRPHLEVFRAELVAVHVDGRQENGLYLVVPQFIGGEVGGDQDLQGRGGDGGAEVSHPRREDAKARSCSRGAVHGGGQHALSPGRAGGRRA